MQYKDIHTAIFSLVYLLFLWLLVFRFYRAFNVSAFRHSIFLIRDQMFDDAAIGMIAFDHPAYLMLRQTMNGFLRYAHTMSLVQFVLFVIMANRDGNQAGSRFRQDWEKATAGLDERTKRQLDRYRFRMDTTVLRYLVVGSPEIVITLIPPLLLFLMWILARQCVRVFTDLLVTKLTTPLNDINALAADYGR